jgi:hypothetical protein
MDTTFAPLPNIEYFKKKKLYISPIIQKHIIHILTDYNFTHFFIVFITGNDGWLER